MATKETDIIIENQNMQVELTDYITFWSSIVGLPSSNTALVEYLNTLLLTKQDLFYYIVATEADKDLIENKKTGTVAFVKATKNLYIYYSEGSTTEWIMLIRDLSNYYTKTETDNLLSLKANIADVYSKIESDTKFATITNLTAEATTRASEDISIRESIKNGKLTIQKNGYTIAEFYANQAGDTTANIVADTPAWGNISGNIQTQSDLQQEFATKQPTLISGTNIKTINNQSLLGSGNIEIQGGSGSTAWGNITGTLSNQTDLQNALNSKANQSSLISEINDRQEADADLQEEINTLTETVNTKVTKNSDITASTHSKITYDSKGLVTLGEDLSLNDLGVTASATELNYSDGVTSNIQTQFNSKVNASDIINNVTDTSTNKPLSANMGKELQDQISNLKARGRFLSEWNSTTGLPETNPTTLPYSYETGSYFIVGTVGNTNYKPTGSQYTGVASSVVETESVSVNDTYLFDGTVWKLLHGADVTVTFASIAGQPYDNSNLSSALNAKQPLLVSGDVVVTKKVTPTASVAEGISVSVDGIESATYSLAKAITGANDNDCTYGVTKLYGPSVTEGISIDGSFNVAGMHQFTNANYLRTNEDNTTAPSGYDFFKTNTKTLQTVAISTKFNAGKLLVNDIKDSTNTYTYSVPNATGILALTSDIPTTISDLTDDTSTNPIDKADTLTGLTATVSELNILDGVTEYTASEIETLWGSL